MWMDDDALNPQVRCGVWPINLCPQPLQTKLKVLLRQAPVNHHKPLQTIPSSKHPSSFTFTNGLNTLFNPQERPKTEQDCYYYFIICLSSSRSKWIMDLRTSLLLTATAWKSSPKTNTTKQKEKHAHHFSFNATDKNQGMKNSNTKDHTYKRN